MDSILNTVKLALGVEADYNGFDTNIILDVNSAIFNLNQLGVGPANGFVVKGEGETWTDLLGNTTQLEAAKSYILAKVRLSFDPPSNSFLVEALHKNIQELEWRLMVKVDPPYNLFSESVLLNQKLFNDALESNLWSDVSAPSGWTWVLPFTVQQRDTDRLFRAKDFDLEAYADIPVTNTYYVSTTGDDANTGLSWEQACRTLNGAFAKTDPDRIYIDAGYYFWDQSGSNTNIARSMKIIGVGDVTLTSDFGNFFTNFVLDGNHYDLTSVSSGSVRIIRDKTVLDETGFPSILTQVVDEASVDITPGSWAYNAPFGLWIHLADGRMPDENVTYQTEGSPFRIVKDNQKLYLENLSLHFGSGLRCENASGVGGLKIYLKNVRSRYQAVTFYSGIRVVGAEEFIAQDCAAERNDGYGFSYVEQNGINPKVIEIDCVSQYNGLTSDQSASAHHLGDILRLNGRYHHSYGANIYDIGAVTRSWNLGVESYSPGLAGGTDRVNRSNFSHGTSGGIMWLDTCYSHDIVDTDLAEDTDGDLRYKDLLSEGQFYGSPSTY